MSLPLSEPVQEFRQTRYRCPYCRRSWTSLQRANGHRDNCWYGPGGCMSCKHVEQAYGGNYVTGCELGEDLADPDGPYGEPTRIIPRGQCPVWKAKA